MIYNIIKYIKTIICPLLPHFNTFTYTSLFVLINILLIRTSFCFLLKNTITMCFSTLFVFFPTKRTHILKIRIHSKFLNVFVFSFFLLTLHMLPLLTVLTENPFLSIIVLLIKCEISIYHITKITIVSKSESFKAVPA